MAFYSIKYNEAGNGDLRYEGIEFSQSRPKEEEIFFNSGDFVKDWYDLTKHVVLNTGEYEPVMGSSTVDHFFMDGADELYDEAYLHDDGNGHELHYEYKPDCLRLYLHKGTKPTWNELRELCGDEKQEK